MANILYYGDNLDVLRRKIRDETVDLCYIDPPFNSKRNYNQIYSTTATQDRAQAQAFIDTWEWDTRAMEGLDSILHNEGNRFTRQTIELIIGLRKVLGEGSLLAYLVSMTLRLVEIHRVLKSTGTFYLHCDPTASHYLKILLDTIFVTKGGEFLNEVIWCYNVGGKGSKHWARKHDDILFYAKGSNWFFDGKAVGIPRETGTKSFGGKIGVDEDGRRYQDKLVKETGKYYRYYLDEPKIPEDWWVGINSIQSQDAERLGYPTQKPAELMMRIVKASCPPDGLVLDAYCGCGTTVSVAQRLGMKWIGIDITYQSISLILRRLEQEVGPTDWPEVRRHISLDGIPQDMQSATALANKQDDRLRKEFEKWAILTYTENRAIINEKKGADAGIDGTAFFQATTTETGTVIFQVKSGSVGRGDIARLRGDMERVGAAMSVLLTLEAPTGPMVETAKAAGLYHHELMGRNYDKINIATIQEIVEQNKRLDLPMSLEVLRKAQSTAAGAEQPALFEL